MVVARPSVWVAGLLLVGAASFGAGGGTPAPNDADSGHAQAAVPRVAGQLTVPAVLAHPAPVTSVSSSIAMSSTRFCVFSIIAPLYSLG